MFFECDCPRVPDVPASAGCVNTVQRVPQATKLLARLLKAESVLLSEAAEPLFRCMVHLLPSLGGSSRVLASGAEVPSAEQEMMLQAMRTRSEQWSSERLHAAVRGTRADQRHPLHSAASGCLPLLQEWLYDSGMSHSDVQDAVAEEAATALHETLHTPLQPAALPHLPGLADTLSCASHWSSSARMTTSAQDILCLWTKCRFSKVTFPLNLLCELTAALIF